MLRKTLLTFNIFDTATIEAEKTEGMKKIWRFKNV